MEKKRQHLLEMMEEYTKEDICIAFSGGIDSSLLLQLAKEAAGKHKTQVYAVTFDTVLHPRSDIKAAKCVAMEMDVSHVVISVNELENEEILNNPRNRCYLCKKSLFQQLQQFAESKNVQYVLDGTNADDLLQYRPGLQALSELGIVSPLALTGFTKTEVRKWAAQLGISVAERPSSPCLATRLPYGGRIEIPLLKKIEKGEGQLRELGFHNVRIRVHGDVTRIEVDKEAFLPLIEKQEEIIHTLKVLGFCYITLDLEGFRSGSMDEPLQKEG